MTRDEFKEKVIYLLDQDNGIRDTILNACMTAMASKMSEGRFLSAADNNFVLPKIVLTAVLQELAWQYEPLDKPSKKIVKELKPLIKF